MYRLLLTLVDIVPAALVLVPAFAVQYLTATGRDCRKTVSYCLFCLYLCAVFSLVGIPNITYFRPEVNLNLIPFAGMLRDLKNSLLNIALFMPLGIFLPVLWTRFRKLSSAVVFGLGLSLTIELLQMLTFRATDVNDLITNAGGTVLGFLLAKPLTGRWPAVSEDRRAVFALCGVSFAVMFFLHPFLSPLIWDRIL